MRECYVARNPHTAWRVYDGEAVILLTEDSTLNSLNVVGTLIWETADGTTSLEAMMSPWISSGTTTPAASLSPFGDAVKGPRSTTGQRKRSGNWRMIPSLRVSAISRMWRWTAS